VAPVGGTVPVKVDLRVIAATHKSVEKMAIRGEFRVDLLARLSGYQHTLTPLRERIEDMGVLARDLLRRSAVAGARDFRFSVEAGRWLLSQRWPLNIRELSKCLEVAAALTEGPVIERAHLIEWTLGAALEPPDEEGLANPEQLRGRLVALLEKHKGNVSYVAR